MLALHSFSGINNVSCSNNSGNGTKSGKFIFDDESPPYFSPHQKARNIEDPEPEQEPEPEPEPDQGTDPEIQPRAPVTTAVSDCPVEGGAVFTKWGTVSLGTVLAGLAAGLFPQEVAVGDLVRRSPPTVILPPEMAGSTVDNRFASTLVGEYGFQFVD